MISRLDGAPSLPIKDEVDLAIEARTREILRDYDVTPEEAAQMARADVMKNMDQSGAPTPAGALARQHQDAGASPDRARKLAENQVQTYGPQGAWGLYREYETPEGMARLMEAQAENKAADARHQKMYDDYYTATNAPSHQRALPETERQWDDTGRYVAESRRLREAGLHPNTPVDPGTPEQGRRWERFLRDNPEEMARYRPDEFAATQAAEDKQAWADKRPLLVKRYGEEEVQKMEAARQRGQAYVPNTAEQSERNQVTQDLETTAMQGNTASRAFLQRRDRERYANVARPRQLRELGIAPEDAAGMSDAKIRILLREQREREKQARDLLWKPRAMIRGGNAIGAMALPGMDEWQLSAIRGGPTPLDVEARQAEMAADMARQAITGFLANTPNMTPEQRAALAQRLRDGDPAGAGASDIGSRKYDTPQADAEFRRLAAQHDTATFGVGSDDMASMARALQQPPYNMSQAEAEAYAYRYMNPRSTFGLPRPGVGPDVGAGGGRPAPPLGPGGGSKL